MPHRLDATGHFSIIESPVSDGFGDAVRVGLGHRPRTIPPRFFYDARGSELFERICALPEYYLTRTEFAVLKRYAHEFPSADTVIEFGCGDGNQLELAKYRGYLGFDVSATAIASCRKRFASDHTKNFRVIGDYAGETADLALSLDVIFHLVEDAVFEAHLATLFNAADRYVIIYSSNSDDNHGYEGTHVRHRRFTDWIATNATAWKMTEQVKNPYPFRGDDREGSFADFYMYVNAGADGRRGQRVPGLAP